MRMGGKVIEQGGDEGLVKVPASAKPHIEELRAQYASVVGATATVGVGKKISESTQARMLGKLKGKNQTVYFDESTARELKLRLQDQEQTEPNKIRAAMAEPTQGGGANEEAKRGRGSDPGAPGDSSGPETASGDPVQASGDGGGATGSEQAPGQAPGQEEGAKPPFSPQLMEEVGKKTPPKEPKAPNLTASLYHDPEIENADYSDSEDPEFSKALAYVAKYGAYGNG